MKKIVIIGNSPAGVKAIEEIRAADQESTFMIIGQEGVLPYNRFLFPELLANALNEKEILYQDEAFYKKLNVDIVRDKSLSRINTKRNKVFLEKKDEKEEVVYDVLIIVDASANKLPEIKGNHRAGVFGLRRFADAQEILKTLPLTDTVAVQSESLWGLEIIEALQKRNKEVIWIHPAKSFLSSCLDEPSAAFLKQQLEAKGIRILEDQSIAEILGDTEAKAIRLKSGKVFAADMVIFPDSRPDLRTYADGGVSISQVSEGLQPRITINQKFQTNFENVYALDEAADVQSAYPSWQTEPSLAALEEQGRTVAAAILGREYTLTMPADQDSALAKIQKRLAAGLAESVAVPEAQT